MGFIRLSAISAALVLSLAHSLPLAHAAGGSTICDISNDSASDPEFGGGSSCGGRVSGIGHPNSGSTSSGMYLGPQSGTGTAIGSNNYNPSSGTFNTTLSTPGGTVYCYAGAGGMIVGDSCYGANGSTTSSGSNGSAGTQTCNHSIASCQAANRIFIANGCFCQDCPAGFTLTGNGQNTCSAPTGLTPCCATGPGNPACTGPGGDVNPAIEVFDPNKCIGVSPSCGLSSAVCAQSNKIFDAVACACVPCQGANQVFDPATQTCKTIPPVQLKACCATGAGRPTCSGPGGQVGVNEVATPSKCIDWMAERCGGHSGFQTSMPNPLPPGMPASFESLMNPMSMCCWNGWTKPGDLSTRKLDCIQRKVDPNEDFLKFYDEGGPRGDPSVPLTAPEAIKHAGVSYPNRLFMLNPAGTSPINGFYNAKGERCSYNSGPKTAQQQMDLFDSALDANAPPADVLPSCCNLIVLGLERTCPTKNPTTGQVWRFGPTTPAVPGTVAGETRCTAASEMKVHFALFDLCDPTMKKRAKFKGATSYGDAQGRGAMPVVPLELDTIIKKTFPGLPAGQCPSGFNFQAGQCVIN